MAGAALDTAVAGSRRRLLGARDGSTKSAGGIIGPAASSSRPRTHAETDLAATSRALRKERELAFHGDIDFIPDDRYDGETAGATLARVDRVLDALSLFEATL
jgi:hypothetical protein